VTSDFEDRERRLDAVIAAYFDRHEAGEAVGPDQVMAEHPEFRSELSRFFAAREHVERIARPLRAIAQFAIAADSPGRLGDFIIHQEIGRGGMGIVYEAEQISLGRRVALKVLPFAAVLDPRQLERFKNEARSAAMLHHPNIVGVHSVGCERGVHYYAMEYIHGINIANVISRSRHAAERPVPCVSSREETEPIGQAGNATANVIGGSQRYRSITLLGIQAADALQYAHRVGVVHRDIKPSNLLVDTSGHLWIADFGLAITQTDSNLSITGDLLGTLRYMSPEHASGDHGAVDHRTDIYSLGITLYEMVAQRSAYDASDRRQLLRQVIEAQPRPLRKIDKNVPKDLETIVQKAMAKVPAARYQTAADLAEDLRRFVEDKPIVARRTGSAERLWRSARRNPLVAGLTALIVFLLILLSVGGPIVAIRQTRLARETNRQNYVLAINAAYKAWEKGDVARTRELLSQHLPALKDEDLRGFEWYYLWTKIEAFSNMPALQHGSAVTSVAFSSDGRLMVTGGEDGTVKLWRNEKPSYQLVETLPSETGMVTAVTFSPSRQLLAATSWDGFATLWNTESGLRKSQLKTSIHPALCLAFSPDGRYLAVGGGSHTADAREGFDIEIWDLAAHRRKTTLEGHHSDVNSIVFSSDGHLLVSGSKDQTVRIWDTDTGRTIRVLRHHRRPVTAVAFSPDYAILATSSARTIKLLNRDDWSLRTVFRYPGHGITSFAFAPEGGTLASAGADGSVRIWDIAAGQLSETIRGHADDVTSVAFSPDGQWLLTGSADHTARIWDVRKHLRQPELDVRGSLWNRIAISSTGKSLVLASSALVKQEDKVVAGEIVLYDLPTGTVRKRFQPGAGKVSVAFSPDGKLLATACKRSNTPSGDIQLWDVPTGELVSKLESLDVQGAFWVVAYSPDGQTIAAGGFDCPITLWDVSSRRVRVTLSPESRGAVAMAFSPDGKTLAESGAVFRERRREARDICLWDVRTGTLARKLVGHTDMVACLAFSPDGKTLASAGHDDVARIWDIATREERLAISGHTHRVTGVAFSPDGKTLATASADTTIKLWQASSGAELATLRGATNFNSLEFSPDGRTLAACDSTKRIWLWHAAREKQDWPVSLR